MKKTILVAAVCAVAGLVQAGVITSQDAAPVLGAEDIGQLNFATTDLENIDGPGAASTAVNDGSTYVANDRTTQGQTFTMAAPGTVEGIWVKHVYYTDELSNGTWSGLGDGASVDIRISSVDGSGNLAVLGSETATVAAGNGIPGGDNNPPYWPGTGKWLYIDLDTTVDLTSAGTYAFDLTSNGPWFELDGLDAEQYGGGSGYTTLAKYNLVTDTVHQGDRAFAVDVIPEPATLALFGLFGAGMLVSRRRSRT